MHLVELTPDIARHVLKPTGSALIKVFQGAGFQPRFQETVAATRRPFAKVKLCKPEASRPWCTELYLLAKGYRLV
jgi:23S rRNA (uridine2552-2'-O)-methyltransferase